MASMVQRAEAVFLAALVSSCGGGGGGGSSPAAAVHIEWSGSPPVAQVQTYEAAWPEWQDMEVHYSGDLDRLAGRTLYVVVEQPNEPIFAESSLDLTPTLEPQVVHLRMQMLALSYGRHAGHVLLRACLDPACSEQLSGSPLLLPYDVDVGHGIQLSTTAVSVQGQVRNPPPPVEVTVEVPPELSAHEAEWLVFGSSTNHISAQRQGNKVLLTFMEAYAPYEHTGLFTIRMVFTDASDRPVVIERDLTVTYTVTP